MRIHHIGVVVDDLAAARSIFADGLGLPVGEVVAGGEAETEFYGAGSADVELIRFADAAVRNERLDGRRSRIDHIAFEVDDLDAVLAALGAAGVSFSEIREARGYRRVFTVPATSADIGLQFVEALP